VDAPKPGYGNLRRTLAPSRSQQLLFIIRAPMNVSRTKWTYLAPLGGLLVLSVASLLPAAGEPRRIWQLDLAKLMHLEPDAGDLVWSARFSPDESQLAIGFGPAWDRDPRSNHLIIIPLDHPQTLGRQFELRSSQAAPRPIPFFPFGLIHLVVAIGSDLSDPRERPAHAAPESSGTM
jgi:hypothetical protein